MRLKIKLFLLALGIVLMTGCNSNIELIEDEMIEDIAIIKNVEYEPSKSYITMIPTGKSIIPITQYTSEKYIVELDYNGVLIKIDNKRIYESLKDKIIESVKCKFRRKRFNDGSSYIEFEDIIEGDDIENEESI